jgi:beta-fructofuranosidase
MRTLALLIGLNAALATAASPLTDKTLVAWVAPANLTQKGGSALTIDDCQTHFDGIVFAELAPAIWMAGSDFHKRTERKQDARAAETAGPTTFVQMAIVYRGKEVTVYRDGKEYSRHTIKEPQAFGPESVVMIGPRHMGNHDFFAGAVDDARIYDRALSAEQIAALKPNAPSEAKPWAWWSFDDGAAKDRMGRFPHARLTGGAKVENGRLVLNGRDGSFFAASRPELLPTKPHQPPVVVTETDAMVRAARLLRERFLADPYRPTYHFCVPEDMGRPGDPNGAFYHNGRYHLMYLYNRLESGFCWGHISSSDLVHWRHHPDAIGPGHGDEGCFSGGAFVDDDGAAYLSYWMLWDAKGIGLAKSSDAAFDVWIKLAANPVIKSTEWGVTETVDAAGKTIFLGSADPSNIWKKDGRYYILTGNLLVLNKIGRKPDAPLSEQGDRLYLFTSDNLKDWKYLHVFYERKPEWTGRSEDNMCPSFLPLLSSPDGGPASGKHLLLFIAHNRGCQYYVGDYRNDRFFPNNHGRMSWVDSTYFAPEALMDGKGRQIMWAWLTDNSPGEKELGWSGVYGLPRSLWLGDDGTLRMAPVKELETLRSHEKSWSNLALADGATKSLEGVVGDACELAIEIEVSAAQRCGLKVRASPGGEEETLLYYDAEKKELVMDSTRSGKVGRKVAERAPFALKAGEPLKLRVFVDKSVVEIYANDRQAIGRRVYPTRPDSLGVSLFANGGAAKARQVKAWQMAPSNPF